MIKNNLKLLQSVLEQVTVTTEDYSCPVPASFLQSLVSAATSVNLNLHPSIAPVFSPSKSFGIAASKIGILMEGMSSIGKMRLEQIRHSNQSTFTNLRFVDNAGVSESFNPLSINFQARFLRSTPSEWRLIVNSTRLRKKRSNGLRYAGNQVYRSMTGGISHKLPMSVLLYFSKQILKLFQQAEQDIQKLEAASRTSHILPYAKSSFLINESLPLIRQATPILSKIVSTISKHDVTPALSREEISILYNIDFHAEMTSLYLPMHHDLLACLFPYIHSLIENNIILPLVPKVLDVYNHAANRDAVKNPQNMPDLA